jgi:hypothetical protein
VTSLRSGPLVAWTNAWLDGQVASDEVLRAVAGSDAPHRVSGLDADAAAEDGAETAAEPLSALLIRWRKGGEPVRLVLPVAGDVRGLPGPAPFRASALDVGEAVVGAGIGVVPEIVEHYPSSAPTEVTWLATHVEASPPDFVAVGDAQYDLTTAIRESASALAAADVAGWSAEFAGALQDARRAGERLVLPPGYPSRAVALVAQAQRLQAVLELAATDPLGGAVDRMGIAARTSALRPLATAVRRALLAGYNAAPA